jgi:hypothetical protein
MQKRAGRSGRNHLTEMIIPGDIDIYGTSIAH